jgi:signal transduction histidine kinase
MNPVICAAVEQSLGAELGPNAVATPLRASGAVFGTLTVSRAPSHASFDSEDRQLLQELADRAALSIENALLFRNAQRERERAEQERARAEAANRAKDEFLAMLGHELRNPLSPILTAVELMRLRGGEVLEKERNIIERQVQHMARLVDDLLNVSRITRGMIELNLIPVELARVVADAIEIASPLLEERSQSLATRVCAVGLPVRADPARLAQLLANLLINAAKYTPVGGQIEVCARRLNGNVVLSVKDDGIGIAPELLPNIFDLFVQGGQGIDRAQGGLGLGLAIARRLAEMHGGTLTAHSEGHGRGAEFVLELPLASGVPRLPVDAATKRAESPTNGHARKVLVVDDNIDAASVLADVLAAVGFAVRTANDGPAALAVAAEFRPDVALLDIGLPVMDGYELGRRLVTAYGHEAPKLVAVTGYGQESDALRSREAGFVEHLVKPLDFTRLQRVIGSLFDNA